MKGAGKRGCGGARGGARRRRRRRRRREIGASGNRGCRAWRRWSVGEREKWRGSARCERSAAGSSLEVARLEQRSDPPRASSSSRGAAEEQEQSRAGAEQSRSRAEQEQSRAGAESRRREQEQRAGAESRSREQEQRAGAESRAGARAAGTKKRGAGGVEATWGRCLHAWDAYSGARGHTVAARGAVEGGEVAVAAAAQVGSSVRGVSGPWAGGFQGGSETCMRERLA
jgi:hypothetical protein